jgi:hypothetical protein
VGDGVPHQVDQRVGHQLHDRGVHLDRLAPDLELDALAGRPRRLPDHAHERREEAADGHHTRAGDLAAQLAAESLDAARVLAHDAHESAQLELDLREVARDLAHPAGQQVEAVVAVELELGEHVSQRHRRRCAPVVPRRLGRRQGAVRVLGFELGDGLCHA